MARCPRILLVAQKWTLPRVTGGLCGAATILVEIDRQRKGFQSTRSSAIAPRRPGIKLDTANRGGLVCHDYAEFSSIIAISRQLHSYQM